MLLLKLTLVPVLLAMVTLVEGRFGPRVGGTLAGMPWVLGPVLSVVVLEQGALFGQSAAESALLAVLASIILLLALAHAATRTATVWALILATGAWALGASAIVIGLKYWPIQATSALVFGAVLMLPLLLPKAVLTLSRTPAPAPSTPRRLELALRMIAGALLTLLVSLLAEQFGPNASGALAAFPVISIVVGGFALHLHGANYLILLARGMARGYFALATYPLVLALSLPRMPIAQALLAACIATAAVQWVAYRCFARWDNSIRAKA